MRLQYNTLYLKWYLINKITIDIMVFTAQHIFLSFPTAPFSFPHHWLLYGCGNWLRFDLIGTAGSG